MAHPVRRPARRAASRARSVPSRVLQRDDAGDLAQALVLPVLRGDDGEHAGHFQGGARCRSTGSSPRRAGCAARSRARPRPARCRRCSGRRPSAGAGPRCGASAGSARTWPWRPRTSRSCVVGAPHHLPRNRPHVKRGGRHCRAGITRHVRHPLVRRRLGPLPAPGRRLDRARRTSPSPAPASSGTRRRASGS